MSKNRDLPRNVYNIFFKHMINFKPNQRNNTFEGVEVISNCYFIVYFGSKPKKQKWRPCNKISLTIFFFL